MCVTKFNPYDYKIHMLISLHLIRDSSWGLLYSASDVGDVSCRQVGKGETNIKLSCTSMEQDPFCESNSFSVS
jgi:hypothetical protein